MSGGQKLLLTERSVVLSNSLSRASRTLKCPGLQMQVVQARGCHTDTTQVHRAFKQLSTPHRMLTVVLDGEYESPGVGVVSAGSLSYETKDAWLERWNGQRQLFVVVMWDASSLDGSAAREPLGAVALRTWRELAERMLAASDQDADRVGHSVLTVLRAAGANPPRLPCSPVPDSVGRLARALSRMQSQLHMMPQWIDLEGELGLGERQMRRLMTSHPRWLGEVGWRKTILSYRLSTAQSLLSAKGTSTREVAAALGYSNDRALLTALRRAGFASNR